MIFYLSEDKEGSPFLKLFNASYGKEVLLGVGGNYNLQDGVRLAASGGNRVIVYMDMVPDNIRLLGIYDSLLDLYYLDGIDVVVFPIVCAEYNFIRSVAELSGPIKDFTDLQSVVSKSIRYKTTKLAESNPVANSASFEKFCKLFCIKCLSSCCSTAGSSAIVSDKFYYSGDCKCNWCDLRLSLDDKSVLYLRQFQVIPENCKVGGYLEVSWDEVVKLSHVMVDEYNNWAVSFNAGYREIRKRV